MTKVYKHPGDWEKHDDESVEHYIARTDVTFDLIAKKAKKVPEGKYLGAMLRFGVGDGYAYYLVHKEKPLTLLWIPYSDKWQADDIFLRGLRLSDVKAMIDSDRAMAKLFGKKRKAG